jgi:hypothetical protein
VLLAIREYKKTPVQAKWLQKFQWQNLTSSYGQALLNDMSEKGLFVFPTHQQVWDHNTIKLLKVNQSYPIAKLSAISKIRSMIVPSSSIKQTKRNTEICCQHDFCIFA